MVVGKYICFAVGVAASLWLGKEIIDNVVEGRHYISTNGLCVQNVESDVAKWVINVTNETDDLKDTQAKRISDKKAVFDFLITNGFDKSEISEDNCNVQDSQLTLDEKKAGKKKYRIVDTIIVNTSKPKLVKKVSGRISDLLEKNVFVTIEIFYYYENIDKLRLSMIEKATQDALERADRIGQTAKSKISALRSLSTGSFSIVSADNSATKESDYYEGERSLNKRVRVVVHASFNLI